MKVHEQKDIFRIMDNRIVEKSQEDLRCRRILFPVRVVWTQGDVENAEVLLQECEQQVSRGDRTLCTMKNYKGKKASILLDYGIEIHGGIQILVRKVMKSDTSNAKVHIRFGESVSEAMSTLGGADNATNDHALRDIYTELSSFSMNPIGETGFRFVRIDLEDEEVVLTLKSVSAVLIYQDFEYKGSFRCSDPMLNRIWDVGAYTVHLNTQKYIWDGIKRDRLVWIGDMHSEIRAIQAVFGEIPAVENSLDFVRNETIMPGWVNEFCTYSMWYIMCVYEWYLYTGNKEFLRKQKMFLVKISEMLSDSIDERGKNIARIGRFLDWPSEGNDKVVDAGIQALHCLAAKNLMEIFKVLKEDELAVQCEKEYEKLAAYPQDYGNAKQAGALLVLAGIKQADKVNDALLKVGGARGMSCFMGYYILNARAMAGDYKGCLDCIREYWGGMLSLGATTFWEDFDIEWLKNASRIDELPEKEKVDVHATYGDYCYKGYRHSLCHGWACGPTPWLSEQVLGIKILEPGFRKVKIESHLGDLEWAEGTYPTPLGIIRVSHKKREDGSVESKIQVPEGIYCEY